jgi:aldehyde dehydrogenase (NAD+)
LTKWVAPTEGRDFDVIDPSTEEATDDPLGGQADTDAAAALPRIP